MEGCLSMLESEVFPPVFNNIEFLVERARTEHAESMELEVLKILVKCSCDVVK